MVPQIIVLVMWFIGALCTAYLHGTPQIHNHNIFGYLIRVVVWFLLLWWGGFFNVWFG